MAVVSFGYPGTIDPGVQWADAQYGIGSRYWVKDVESVRVTPRVGGSREVAISVGFFGGWGVTDYNNSVAYVQLPTVASGTQWFMIVARRTWGVDAASSATTFTYIDAGTAATIPARNTAPGELDDQPLALVSLTAGQTLPANTIPLRVIGVGKEDYLIESEMALSYIAAAGVRARLGSTNYQYGLDATGSTHTWHVDRGPHGNTPLVVASGSSVLTSSPGWGVVSAEAVKYGNNVDIYFQLQRTGGGAIIGNSSDGNIADTTIATVAPEFRPSRHVMYSAPYMGRTSSSSTRTTYTGEFFIHPNGSVVIQSFQRGTGIWPESGWAIWHHQNYTQFS